MKKYAAWILVTALLFALALTPASAQTAKEILAKMIEAQGGAKALGAIKDQTLTANLDMVQMGMKGSITLYSKEPNKMRMDIEIAGMLISQAYDGEKARMANPQTGSIDDLPDNLNQEFKRQALGNDALLHPEKYGITHEFKGKEKIQDKEYLVLDWKLSDGHIITYYIDPETYLPYKTKTMGLSQTGAEALIEMVTTDYQKVEGIMIAQAITQNQDGQEFMRMTITKVTFNSNLDDAFFKLAK